MALCAAACAPVLRPPPSPSGFVASPRASYRGVLGVQGALAPGDPAPAATASVAASLVIEPAGDGWAVVGVGDHCSFAASIVTPTYADVPGRGYVRRSEGVLAVKGGSSCRIENGPSVTLGAGTVVTKQDGTVDVTAAGADAAGRAGALRFDGAIVDERDMSSLPPDETEVHFSGELVTWCPSCRVNHRSLADANAFPFAPELQRLSGGATWTPVCVAPCAARVDAGATLRVAGVGISESDPFVLPTGRPRVALEASGSGTGARFFGWCFVLAGASFVGVGATELGIGERERDPSKAHGLELGGALFAASSLAFFIPAAIVLDHDRTTVMTDAGETLTSRAAPPRSFALIPGGFAF